MKKGIVLSIAALLGVCILVISFVRNRGVRPNFYYSWHNSKESTVSKWNTASPFLFNAMYRPEEFMALSELNGEKLNRAAFNKALKNYECCEHVLLRIFAQDTVSEALAHNIKNEGEYYERIRFLNSEFGSHTYLIDGTDTLPCTFFLFERTYKMQPFISVNLIYEKKVKERGRQMTLVVEPTIFNEQILKFIYSEGELKEIPTLKI